jgi:hypothetical protein
VKRTRPQEWSEAELRGLEAMARQKLETRQIALSLGRHVASVTKKMRELGLVPRKRLVRL